MHVPDAVRADLKRRENVIGVGVGRADDAGDEEVILVFVTEKVPEQDLDPTDVCPRTVAIDDHEVRTDVVEAGEPRLLEAAEVAASATDPDRTQRYRPAPASVSVGHPDVTAGTLGTPPLVTEGGDRVFLTNAHVAAPQGATVGDPCLQPGPADGGTDGDEIGTLAEYSPISREEPNDSDSALVAVDEDALRPNDILEIGELAGWEDVAFGETVEKSGRTTGVTTGSLVARDVEIDVAGYYPDESVTFRGVDAFTPMSDGGDSGSLIGVHAGDGFRGTNLLFAGSPLVTFGIPMDAVEDEHGRLSIAHPPSDGGDGGSESLLASILASIRRLLEWLLP